MTDWRHSAACRTGVSPELFFPVGTSGPALVQAEQAKAVCRRCKVAEECLQWALTVGQDSGVWGGMTEHERAAVRRRSADGQVKAPRPSSWSRGRAPVDAEAIKRVRELAGEGLSDPEIAARLGETKAWVCQVRRNADIPAGYVRGRRTEAAS